MIIWNKETNSYISLLLSCCYFYYYQYHCFRLICCYYNYVCIYIYISLSLILIVHWSLGVYTLFSNKPSPMVFLTGLAQEQTGAQDGIDHTFGAFEKPLLNAKASKSEPKSDSVLNRFLYVWRNHLRFLGVWAILYCMWIIHYVNKWIILY